MEIRWNREDKYGVNVLVKIEQSWSERWSKDGTGRKHIA